MGTLTPSQLHEWLGTILEFEYCDVILGDESLDLTGVPVPVIQRNLKSERDPSHYGREPLTNAFREILTT